MSRKAGIFVGFVAGTALGISILSLLIKREELIVLNATYELIHQHIVDGEFVDIINRYDEDGD